MKKKIAILGSTGSIGKNLVNIIKKDKSSFEVVLLTANKNYKALNKQSKLLNVKFSLLKNVIDINNKIRLSYNDLSEREKNQNIDYDIN